MKKSNWKKGNLPPPNGKSTRQYRFATAQSLQIAPLPVARREHRENQHKRNQRLHENRLHPCDAHCHPVAAETLPVNLLPGHREQQRRSGHRPATLEGHVQNSPQQADFPRQKEGNRHRRVNMAAADARDAPDHRGHGQTEGDADPGHERVRTLRGVRGDRRATAHEDQEARTDKFGRERLPEGDLPEVLDAAAWIDEPHFDVSLEKNQNEFSNFWKGKSLKDWVEKSWPSLTKTVRHFIGSFGN